MRRSLPPVLLVLLLPLQAVPAQPEPLTLDEVLTLGLEHNLQLRAGAEEVASLEAAWRAARLFFNPSVGFETGSGESYDGSIRRTTRGISLSQPLEYPFSRRARISMAENEWRAAESAQHSLALDIRYDITEHYLRILLLAEWGELARSTLESFERAHRLVIRRLELGEARELEAIKLEVEVMRARTDLSRIEAEQRLTRRHLDALVGDTLPEAFVPVPVEEFAPIVAMEDELIARALEGHPLIGRSQFELTRARDRLRAARAARIPDPALTGFLREELHGRIQGLGVTFALPLFDLGAHRVAEARSLAEGREYALEALELELAAEISILYGRLELAAETIGFFRDGLLHQAEESLRIAESSYHGGEISLLDWLDAQRTYSSILTDYHDALYTWHQNRAALERAVGGEIR